MELPIDLRDALDAALAGTPARELAGVVDGLIERYRTPGAALEPILARPVDVLGYAAYRMPATYAAVRAALAQVAQAVPWFAPKTLLDLGGGTGAAAWAVADTFPLLASVEVVDRAPVALALGRRLGAASARPALRGATWRLATWRADRTAPDATGPDSTTSDATAPDSAAPDSAAGPELAAADLVTISYLLGELPDADQADLVARAAAAAGTAGSAGMVVVVEPGTPDGYRRVLAARERLLAAGMRVVAPCAHDGACPIQPGRDWCHFSVRINRSALHRRVKGAELGYEDEKFSYLAAVSSGPGAAALRPGRILRHPLHRKGMVLLRVCSTDGTAVAETVSKRQGERYRAARDLAWGDVWPAPTGADARDDSHS